MKVWDKNKGADTCVRASLYLTARKILALRGRDTWTGNDKKDFDEFVKYCGLDGWFSHRKSPRYRWADDVHPGKWSIRYFIYKLNGFNPACGLNCDQYRAYCNLLYINHDVLGALKVFVAIMLHGFFLPSMTEHIFLKPHTLIMAFKSHWAFYPMYLLVYPLWYISMKKNLITTIQKDTSNKINLLCQMYLLGYELPTPGYICEVYDTYFKPGTDCAFIGETLKRSLI